MNQKVISRAAIENHLKQAALSGPLSRDALIEATVAAYEEKNAPLKKKEDRDRLAVYVASLLPGALESRLLSKKGDLFILGPAATLHFNQEDIEKEILSFLSGGQYTKRQIFNHLTKVFSVEKTKSRKDDLSLLSLAGQILKRLPSEGLTEDQNGRFCRLPSVLDKHFSYDELYPELFSELYSRGGAFFESFVCGLLEKFFRISGKKILRCEVSGGSSDGGIDCLIDTEDALGFIEYHVIQTKCRKSMHVTEKEIREFFGAMNIKKGTRGLFVTTSHFHPAAAALLDTLPDCIGIDGDKLRELSALCQYGFIDNRDGSFSLDPLIFGC